LFITTLSRSACLAVSTAERRLVDGFSKIGKRFFDLLDGWDTLTKQRRFEVPDFHGMPGCVLRIVAAALYPHSRI
jgi:hypothetical protein